MGEKGLGKLQRKAREKTDRKIIRFIKTHPGAYVRQIIRNSGVKSPVAVENSLRRLYKNKKIIKLSESEFFKKIKIPKNSVGYIINFQNKKKEKTEFMKFCKLEQNNLLSKMKNFQNEQFKQQKPIILRLANMTSKGLQVNSSIVIKDMQRRLGISAVNESMIGFFVFKLLEEIDLKKDDIPWAPEFYYKMLPKKYCYIDIPYKDMLIKFINYNFHNKLDFKELIHKNFVYFNSKTKHLINTNFKEIMEKMGYKVIKDVTSNTKKRN